VQSINKYQIEVGGPLHDGDPGLRLIEPEKDKAPNYFPGIPEEFQVRSGQYFLLPVYHIFGSEELSAQSAAIIKVMPQPYVAMNQNTAHMLQLEDNIINSVTINGEQEIQAKIKINPDIPDTVIGFPIGLPGFESLAPGWASLQKAME